MAEEKKDSVENTEENKAQAVENTAKETKQEVETPAEEIKEEAPASEETPKSVEEKVEAPKTEKVEVAEETTEEEAPKKEKVAIEDWVKEAPAERPAEFDWEGLEAGIDTYTKEEREELDERYSKTLTSIEEKAVIDGTVVTVGKKEVVINLGYKSEGIIQTSEFRYNPDLKAGDVVPIYVEQQEDKNGQLVISHKTARVHSAWDNVNAALENGEIIMGFVKCRTKGGLIVDVFGIEAFLPGSQIDVKPIRDYDIYVGKQMEFKVVKINQEFKNIVVSHKALIEAELEEQKKKIMAGLEKGQVLEGTVKNITSYGVFIDLGGVDGLVHITDLSWGRINQPDEVVELDQKINVVILDFDDDKKRIALGLKQLSAHPWDSLDEKINVGDKLKGKVVVLADYGAFVEVAPGVEGLLHVSEMSWSQHLRSAQDFLKVGDEVETEILTLDREERRMSLGMKQLIADPWEKIEDRYPVESKHEAIVRNFTNFGVFVELEEGVDGLIHISDLSWSKRVKHPSEFCKVDEKMEVVVLEVDRDSRRLSLGHKQLEENPWDVFETLFATGSVHPGTITKNEGNQYVVSLPYGVEGFCTTKHMVKQDGSTAKVEESLDFKVIEFNKNAKRIVVSHLRTYEDGVDEKKPRKSTGGSKSGGAVKTVQNKIEKTTLGDLSVLSSLKDEMEKDDKKATAPKKVAAKKAAPKKAAAKKEEEVKEEAPKETEAKKEEVKEEAPKKAEAKKEEEVKEEAPKKKAAAKAKKAVKEEEAPKEEKATEAEAKKSDEEEEK